MEERIPAILESSIRRIREEQVKGASWALLEAARGVLETLEAGHSVCRNASRVAGEIVNANPTMTTLEWVATVILKACSEGGDGFLAEALRRLVEYQSRARRLLADRNNRLLDGIGSVMVYSYSSSVETLILSSRSKPSIIVLESRPGGEGVFFAGRLADEGYRVRLAPDMAACAMSREADALLIGADAVTVDGCLYNKVGTCLLAGCLSRLDIPVVSVFDATKISPSRECNGIPITRRTYSVEGYGIVEYPLFDATPFEWVSLFATEEGPLKPSPGVARDLRDKLLSYVL